MKMRFVQAALLIVAFGIAGEVNSCTTFVLSDGNALLFGRNLDWFWGDGFIVVNQKGIEKTAFVRPPEKPVRWISKYGSVTFNQFGREMPFGGINEVGLVVEQMMLFDTQYPAPDNRPAINMLQWIQYQLDNCRTVEEVIATDKSVRQEAPLGKERIHYLICDASGDSATIEFLDGKLVCHRGDTMPAKALANNTYRKSAEFMKPYARLSGAAPLPGGKESLYRFTRAAKCSIDFQSRSPAADREYGFRNLSDVAQDNFTVWSIVYDIPNRKIYYRTRDNKSIRWFSLEDFDYAPHAAPVFLDINAHGEGHVASDFQKLTEDLHKAYLQEFFGKKDLKEMLGELSPFYHGLVATLKSYRPKAQK